MKFYFLVTSPIEHVEYKKKKKKNPNSKKYFET